MDGAGSGGEDEKRIREDRSYKIIIEYITDLQW